MKDLDPVINNIAVIPLVLGLVQFAKKFGLSGNKLTALAGVLGVVFAVLYQIGQLYPDVQIWLNIVVYGTSVGLSAAGLYDLSKTYGKPNAG